MQQPRRAKSRRPRAEPITPSTPGKGDQPSDGWSPSAQPDDSDSAWALSSVDVRSVRFAKPPMGETGYDEKEVDDFLAVIAEALAGRSTLSPHEVRNVIFTKAQSARHGYDAHQVDIFLNRVEWQLKSGLAAPTQLHTGADLLAIRIPRTPRGYRINEVDAFLSRAAAALDSHGPMTAREVYQTKFSSTSGLHLGYRMTNVDALLEILEQELRSRGR